MLCWADGGWSRQRGIGYAAARIEGSPLPVVLPVFEETTSSLGCELRAIVLARAAGMQVMICTGRECEAVRCRAQDLHIDYLFQNVHDKAAFLSRFMAEHSLTKQDVAYCGDDLNDLTAMALCGFVACPADAAGPVLGRADFICRQKGGEGAVRGTVEEILLRDGRLPAAVKKAFGAKI